MNKKPLLLTTLLFLQLWNVLCYKDSDDYVSSKKERGSKVEIRAVLVNCEPNERREGIEVTRFERQELFKHNTLQECNKKLTLTVKLNSERTPVDDYIPIDHVIEGPSKRRVRLLSPYILRLRRDPLIQAYKLRRIDTVSGVLTKSNNDFEDFKIINKRMRSQRNTNNIGETEEALALGPAASVFTLEHDEPGRNSFSVRINNIPDVLPNPPTAAPDLQVSKDCGLRLFSEPSPKSFQSLSRLMAITPPVERQRNLGKHHRKGQFTARKGMCPKINKTIRTREKYYNLNTNGRSNNKAYHVSQNLSQTLDSSRGVRGIKDDMPRSAKDYYQQVMNKETVQPHLRVNMHEKERGGIHSSNIAKKELLNETGKDADDIASKNAMNKELLQVNKSRSIKRRASKNSKTINESHLNSNDRDFALYEIGSPDLWYSLHAQLFEKLSSPDGKTIWNDMTKGDEVSVGSTNPEWANMDMSLRYRSTEWVPRDDFTLPTTSLCLLVPIHESDYNVSDSDTLSESGVEEYIVVPVEDVMGVEDDIQVLFKREGNDSDVSGESTPPTKHDERPRRVEVRVTRALFGGGKDGFEITTVGSERFLTLPHRRPHHAQIDLEIRADDNQVIRVGSSGSISTIIADSTRKARTTLTLLATNTGLASARFRVVARDCRPELSELVNDKTEGAATGTVVVAPMHTKRLHLELPMDMPVDIAQCSVALINDEDESVAIRNVAIKKGDRCFCVWHCDCVCLSEDPKLLCREMSLSRQAAAGLATADRARRHVRATCYKDDLSINITVVIFGVLLLLLVLGFLKAIVGLKCRCVAYYGLHHMMQFPRKLTQYHEPRLRCRTVVYDNEGWPVHPDTKKRTVLLVSRPMMFALNCMFFVIVPLLMLSDSIKQIVKHCRTCREKCKTTHHEEKKCFSSQDIQSVELYLRRRKKPGLQRWMTPFAEELSTDIWNGPKRPPASPRVAKAKPGIMRPLLPEDIHGRISEDPSIADSEQDDTEYVLMQMQKSRESLARISAKN